VKKKGRTTTYNYSPNDEVLSSDNSCVVTEF
jgi:hypothetical protein